VTPSERESEAIRLLDELVAATALDYMTPKHLKEVAEFNRILEQDKDMQIAIVRNCAERLSTMAETLGKPRGVDYTFLNLYHQNGFPWESYIVIPILLRRKLPWSTEDLVFIVNRISDIGLIWTFSLPFLPQLVKVIGRHVDNHGITTDLKRSLRRMKKALRHVQERAAERKLSRSLDDLIAIRV